MWIKEKIKQKTRKKLFKLFLTEIAELNKIEQLIENYNNLYSEDRIYDTQEYINYKDNLNLLSIDIDRI